MGDRPVDPWLSRRREQAAAAPSSTPSPPPSASAPSPSSTPPAPAVAVEPVLADVERHPAVLALRKDRRAGVLQVAAVLHGAQGALPSWPQIQAATGLGRATVARHVALLKALGLHPVAPEPEPVPAAVTGGRDFEGAEEFVEHLRDLDRRATEAEDAQGQVDHEVDVVPDGATRDTAMLIRLLPSERDAWHAAARAERRGKTAGWVRDVVNAVVTGERVDPTRQVPRTVPPWVRRDLSAIGSNINQLAHRANVAAREGQPVGGLIKEIRAAKVELELLRLTLGGGEE